MTEMNNVHEFCIGLGILLLVAYTVFKLNTAVEWSVILSSFGIPLGLDLCFVLLVIVTRILYEIL